MKKEEIACGIIVCLVVSAVFYFAFLIPINAVSSSEIKEYYGIIVNFTPPSAHGYCVIETEDGLKHSVGSQYGTRASICFY